MKDTVCVCDHWYEEHDDQGCFAPTAADIAPTLNAQGYHECPCEAFMFDPAANTSGAIAERGGEHRSETCECAFCYWFRNIQHDIDHPSSETCPACRATDLVEAAH